MKYKITLKDGSELIVYINEDRAPKNLLEKAKIDTLIQNLPFSQEQASRTISVTKIKEFKGDYKVWYWDGLELSDHLVKASELTNPNPQILPKIETLDEENKKWIMKYTKEYLMYLIYQIAAKNAKNENIIISGNRDLTSFFNIGNPTTRELKPDVLKASQKEEVLKSLYKQVEPLSLEEFHQIFNQFLSNLNENNRFIKKADVELAIGKKLQFTPDILSIELENELALEKTRCFVKAKENVAELIYESIKNYYQIIFKNYNNSIININIFNDEITKNNEIIEKCNYAFLPFLPSTKKIKNNLFPNNKLIEPEAFKNIFCKARLGLIYEKINDELIKGKTSRKIDAIKSAYEEKPIYQKYFNLDLSQKKFEFAHQFSDLLPRIKKNKVIQDVGVINSHTKELQCFNVNDPNKDRKTTFYFPQKLATKLASKKSDQKKSNEAFSVDYLKDYLKGCYNLLTEEVLNETNEFYILANDPLNPIIIYQNNYQGNPLKIIVAIKNNFTPHENCIVERTKDFKTPIWIETKSYSLTYGSLEKALAFTNLLNTNIEIKKSVEAKEAAAFTNPLNRPGEIVKHLEPLDQLNYFKLKIALCITEAIVEYSKTSDSDLDKFNFNVNDESFQFVDLNEHSVTYIDFRKYNLYQIKAILNELTKSINDSYFSPQFKAIKDTFDGFPVLIKKGKCEFPTEAHALELFITELSQTNNTPRSSQTNTPQYTSEEDSDTIEEFKKESKTNNLEEEKHETIAERQRKRAPISIKVNNVRFDSIQLSKIEEIKVHILKAIVDTYTGIENDDKDGEKRIFDKILEGNIDNEQNQFLFAKLSLRDMIIKLDKLNKKLEKFKKKNPQSLVAESLRSNLNVLDILQVNVHSIQLDPTNDVMLNNSPTENNVNLGQYNDESLNTLFTLKDTLREKLNLVIIKLREEIKPRDLDDIQKSLLEECIENEKYYYPGNHNQDLLLFEYMKEDCKQRLEAIRKLSEDLEPVKIYLNLLSEKIILQNELNENEIEKQPSSLKPLLTDGLYEFLRDAHNQEAIKKLHKEIRELKERKNIETLNKISNLVKAINNVPNNNLFYILIEKEKANPNLSSYFTKQIKVINNLSYDKYLSNKDFYESLLHLSQQIVNQEQYKKIRRLFSAYNKLLDKLVSLRDKIEKINNQNNHTFCLLDSNKDQLIASCKEKYIKLDIDEKLKELDSMAKVAANSHSTLFTSDESLDTKLELYEIELNKLDLKKHEAIVKQLEEFMENELPDSSKKILAHINTNLTPTTFNPGKEVELETLGYSLDEKEAQFLNAQIESLNALKSEFEFNDVFFTTQLEHYQTSIQIRNPKTNPIKCYDFVTKAKKNCEATQNKYDEELDKLNKFIESINAQNRIKYCDNKIIEIEKALSQIQLLPELLPQNNNIEDPENEITLKLKVPGFLNAEFFTLIKNAKKLIESGSLLEDFKNELIKNQSVIDQKDIFDRILNNYVKTGALLISLSEKDYEAFVEKLKFCYKTISDAKEIFKNTKELVGDLPKEIINLKELNKLESQFYNPEISIDLEKLKINIIDYKNKLLENLHKEIDFKINLQKELLEQNPLHPDCFQSLNKNLKEVANHHGKLLSDNQQYAMQLQTQKQYTGANHFDDRIKNAKLLLNNIPTIDQHLKDVECVNLVFQQVKFCNKKIADIEKAISQLDSLKKTLEELSIQQEKDLAISAYYQNSYQPSLDAAKFLMNSRQPLESYKSTLIEYKTEVEELDDPINSPPQGLKEIISAYQDFSLQTFAKDTKICGKKIKEYLETITGLLEENKRYAVLPDNRSGQNYISNNNRPPPKNPDLLDGEEHHPKPKPTFWSRVSEFLSPVAEFFSPLTDHFIKYGGYYTGGLAILGGGLLITAGILTLTAGIGVPLISGGVAACGVGGYMIIENSTKSSKKKKSDGKKQPANEDALNQNAKPHSEARSLSPANLYKALRVSPESRRRSKSTSSVSDEPIEMYPDSSNSKEVVQTHNIPTKLVASGGENYEITSHRKP